MQPSRPEKDSTYVTLYIFKIIIFKRSVYVIVTQMKRVRKTTNLRFNTQLPGEILINSHLLLTFFQAFQNVIKSLHSICFSLLRGQQRTNK